MPLSKASTAILAKARAMYGKCLSDKDYEELVGCRTVSEVASYLKTRTEYASALVGLNDSDVHRGQLETLLKQNIYYDVSALSRYEQDKSTGFSDFIISRMEIEQIIRCLTLVNIGKAQEYVYTMPLSLDKFAKISLKDLTSVRSYDDILDVLKGTGYFPTLSKFKPKESERINIAELEVQLNNDNFGRVINSISNARNKNDREELKDLFSAMIDFKNVARIIRMKKYYNNFSSEKIKAQLIPYGKLKNRILNEMCEAETVQDVFEISRSTYLGRLLAKLQYNDQTQITDALLNNYCKHHLRLSRNPRIVMISYIYLKSIELSNIVNIIEGTRYGISADKKSKLLVR